MKKSFEEIRKDIKAKAYNPIYLLTGQENFYIDSLSKDFENNILEEEDKAFNFLMVYGKDISADTILNYAKQYPVMSEYRLVIIKEGQDMDKREWAKLMSYFTNPTPSTILVISYKYNKFPANLIKAIEKSNGAVYDSKKIRDYQLNSWIQSYTKEIGLKLDSEAIGIIGESLGNNLEKISNELSKLSLNIQKDETITKDHIEEYIGINRDYNVFELQNALGKRDIYKANQIIFYFDANQKDNPINLIIANLYSYFLKLILVAQLPNKTDGEIAKAVGCHPIFAKDYRNATSIYPQHKLFQIIDVIRDYDMKSKGLGGDLSYGDILKELTFKITH